MMLSTLSSLPRRALPALIGLLLLSSPATGLAGVLPVVGQVPPEQRKICAEPIRHHEREAGVPNQLLAAVARAESGRWDKADSASFAWPWTVTAEGKGQFFATKQEAIDQVIRLRGRGVRNIDVGCMQVNLLHHPDAFASLEDALDPKTNVAYATSFLKQLFEQHRSWVVAVGNYHSATPEFHFRYREKVMKLWSDERRRDAEARRQEVVAAYQERRQQALSREQRNGLPDATEDGTGDSAPFAVADSRPDAGSQIGGAIAATRRQPPASPIPQAPASTSFRVTSQIPSGAGAPAMGRSAPASSQAAPGRVMPRTTSVPLERRF
jgi:hypothetical protein